VVKLTPATVKAATAAIVMIAMVLLFITYGIYGDSFSAICELCPDIKEYVTIFLLAIRVGSIYVKTTPRIIIT
jgi:hypothetical protein